MHTVKVIAVGSFIHEVQEYVLDGPILPALTHATSEMNTSTNTNNVQANPPVQSK